MTLQFLPARSYTDTLRPYLHRQRATFTIPIPEYLVEIVEIPTRARARE